MEKLNSLRNQQKTYQQLALDNRAAIQAHNQKMLSTLSLLGSLLMLLQLLVTIFDDTTMDLIILYWLEIFVCLLLFFLFRLPAMKKYSLWGLYTCCSMFFILAIYLSVIYAPDMRATILLVVFCITPLGFIDHPWRINLFIAAWLIVHTVLAFHFKPQFINALHDASNGLSVAILGCYLGNRMVRIRLDSYEAHRLLTIQKETDVLTGLSSRRKLFETLAALETADAPKPTGVLMVDIDHFKELNDSYGHAAGDRCLGQFGEVLQAFSHSHRLHFYRYGGEEFVAMAYGYDRQELLFIADRLRLAVQAMQMHEHPITVSIGVAYCGDEQVDNYEKVIHRADNVLYKAKHTGRNRVYMEQQGRMGAQERAL